MHAEEGKPCRKTDCEHFGKSVKRPSGGSDRIVSRVPKAGTEPKAGADAKAKAVNTAGRPTKKSKLKKPRRWGGRSLPNG